MPFAMCCTPGTFPCDRTSGSEVPLEALQPWIPQIAIAALALSVGLGIACALLALRVRRFSQPFDDLAKKAADGDLAAALQAQLLGVDQNRRSIQETHAYVRRVRTQTLNAVQGIGFQRYDAFDDIRGNQSYSLCLLDAHQNGLLLTSIAGRTDSRGYAKPIENGNCELAMSEEESEVLLSAKESLSSVEEPVVVGV